MSARVILVHEDLPFLELAKTTLLAAGFQVAAFSNSMDAWAEISDGGPFDILVTSLGLPEGTPNGVALAHRARLEAGARIIFIAAAGDSGQTDNLGPVLGMPVSAERLLLAVQQAASAG